MPRPRRCRGKLTRCLAAYPQIPNLLVSAECLLRDYNEIGDKITNAGQCLRVMLCRAGLPFEKKKSAVIVIDSEDEDDEDEDEDEDEEDADATAGELATVRTAIIILFAQLIVQ